MNHWLITYQQEAMGRWMTATAISDKHPVEFLISASQYGRAVILFALPISEEQYRAAKERI